MSNGRLKAATNRVRTSTTLQGNAMWSQTIGAVDPQAGSNSVIEASLNAPGGAPGGGRAARQASAQEIVAKTGSFGGPDVKNYEGLLMLARSQGAVSGLNRGACKMCGQLGHLTKQCRNHLSTFFDQAASNVAAAGAQLQARGDIDAQPSDLSSTFSSSDSDSDADSGDRQRRKKRRREEGRDALAKAEKRARKEAKKERRRREKREKKEKAKRGAKNKKRRRASGSASD